MAFELITSTERYLCLSTDIKPTVGIKKSALAKETDTNNEYIFNGTTWEPYSQSTKLVGSLAKVIDIFSGAATVTRTYATADHTRLEVCNDGGSSLTFTVNSLVGRTFTVLAGEVREFEVPAFSVVVITTTVAYRATVMGGTVEVGVSS